MERGRCGAPKTCLLLLVGGAWYAVVVGWVERGRSRWLIDKEMCADVAPGAPQASGESSESDEGSAADASRSIVMLLERRHVHSERAVLLSDKESLWLQ